MYSFTYPNKEIHFNEDLLMDYGLWRFKNDGISRGTLRKDITGINCFLGYYYNKRNPTGIGKADRLIQFYRGMQRWYKKLGIGNKTYQRRALVDIMLYAMLDHVPGDSYIENVTRALLLFAKQTAFRSHNCVYTARGGFARIEHIKFNFLAEGNPNACIIELPHAKTKQKYDPGKETRTLHCRCSTVGKKKCAVHALYLICKERLKRKKQALFLLPNGFPVTYNIYRQILKVLCDAVGIDHHYYTPHALRIGEATDRSMRGDSIESIMKFIQWKTRESAMIYIRPNNVDFVKFQIIT